MQKHPLMKISLITSSDLSWTLQLTPTMFIG